MAPRANGLNLAKRNVASPRSPHYYCARDTDKTPDFTRAKGQRQKAKKKKKKKKRKKKKASNSGKKRMGNEETKRMKENNNGMAEVPLTCNLANARELGPMVREITEMMVWWKGKKSLVSILLGPLLADTMLGKHLYQNG